MVQMAFRSEQQQATHLLIDDYLRTSFSHRRNNQVRRVNNNTDTRQSSKSSDINNDKTHNGNNQDLFHMNVGNKSTSSKSSNSSDLKHDMTQSSSYNPDTKRPAKSLQISTSSALLPEQQQFKRSSPQHNAIRLPTIDVLSVGSRLLPHLQATQRATFGSHKAVRHFYGATEDDDSETECGKRLSRKDAVRIAMHCRTGHQSKHPILAKLVKRFIEKTKLAKKQNPSGWLCAQKRPLDGFMNMIKNYQYVSNGNNTNLPDYLLVLDDDSWVNLDHMLHQVTKEYPVTQPQVVAGCLIVMDDFIDFTFPHGGFGVLFNRMALERFLQPLHCGNEYQDQGQNHTNITSSPSLTRSSSSQTMSPEHLEPPFAWDEKKGKDFERLACWRLKQNGIGERSLFRNGMSVATLMHKYATDQPYNKHSHWNDAGYCLHSDTAWAYFVNYYHLAVQPKHRHFAKRESTGKRYKDGFSLSDRFVGYNQSQIKFWDKDMGNPDMWRQCRNGNDLAPFPINGNDNCGQDAHFCHRITHSHMQHLHEINRKRFPIHYHP